MNVAVNVCDKWLHKLGGCVAAIDVVTVEGDATGDATDTFEGRGVSTTSTEVTIGLIDASTTYTSRKQETANRTLVM